jgi:catechol-2,3-dioxygenase
MDIAALDHVALNVASLEVSAEWYARVLGFKVFHKWTRTWMIARDGLRIGLFHRPDAVPVVDLDNARAITHFAFVTDASGFERAQTELRTLGVTFEGPEDTGIANSIFFSDPDGFSVEITAYYAVSAPPQERPDCQRPSKRSQ